MSKIIEIYMSGFESHSSATSWRMKVIRDVADLAGNMLRDGEDIDMGGLIARTLAVAEKPSEDIGARESAFNALRHMIHHMGAVLHAHRQDGFGADKEFATAAQAKRETLKNMMPAPDQYLGKLLDVASAHTNHNRVRKAAFAAYLSGTNIYAQVFLHRESEENYARARRLQTEFPTAYWASVKGARGRPSTP